MHQVYDNEIEFYPYNEVIRERCCDCGLTHNVLMKRRHEDDGVYVIVERNKPATAAVRRRVDVKRSIKDICRKLR
jgi:hypothetical protein